MRTGPSLAVNDYFLADDLSGALDAAAAFHRVGRAVRVAWSDAGVAAAGPGEVVAMTTETRNAVPEMAAATVTSVLSSLRRRGGRLLYKKIDSTMRGPVAAELAAVMAAFPGARILFAPANPRVGRTIQNGVLLVHGVPVAETDFGRDPASPLRQSAVRDILGAVAGPRVSIPDILHDSDLERAIAMMDAEPGEWVAVGSGALAVPMARRGLTMGSSAATANPVPPPPNPAVAMLGGSAHPLNRRQAELLARRYNVSAFELPVDQPTSVRAAAREAIERDGAVIVQSPARRIPPGVALELMAGAGAALIIEGGVRRVFVTGGEMAFALCARIGVTSLAFLAEIEPGLSLSVTSLSGETLLIAVKPGGFGDEATWVRAFDALRGYGLVTGGLR